MVLPSNFKSNTLYPHIVIKDETGSTQYTHQSLANYPAGTRDFEVNSLRLIAGQNGAFGSMILVIPDNNNALTDTTTPRRPSLIEQEWEITLDLGVTSGTEYRAFHGKIKHVQVDRPGTNQQQIILVCVGWGVVLRERITRLVRNQDKDADGIGLDDNDTKTRVDQLALDLFNDLDHYVDENITQLANITAALTTDGLGICQTCTDVKLANVNFSTSTFAQALGTLSSISNTTWRINEDRKLILHDSGAHDSGMLFSNDINTTGDTSNWTSTKIGYILNAPVTWVDDSIDTFYNFIHGFGHFTPVLAASDGQTPDSSRALDNGANPGYVAIPFSFEKDNLFKIALRMVKTGTPATPHKVEIWGVTSGGDPNPTDVRRVIDLTKERLQALGTGVPADWFEIPIKPRLDIRPGEQLYIVFQKYGDASNTININYKAGTGTFEDSSDGITWTSRTGQMAYRVYDAKRLTSTLEITDTTSRLAEPREKLIPIRSDLEEQTVRQSMLAAGEILGKTKRTYDKLTVSVPQDRVNVSQFCRIIDTQSGLDIKANIIGWEMSGDADSGDIGITTMSLLLEDAFYQ
jgi:hypothetical protein